ncbi:GTPase RsgA [Cryptosporangium minutisporangium]|uniref:GTPase RsgA n=1 Tax=Cryptosporangium minutisporangium TaxID=113569 RepID=UPI0035EEB8DF
MARRLSTGCGPLVPARVTDVDDDGCGCLAATGPVRAVAEPGLTPVAGDWAVLAGNALVAVLPRTSVVRRGRGADDVCGEVLAANVDLVLVVQTFSATLSPDRTERLLALAAASSATPVLVLSQIDRAPDGAVVRSVLADLAVLAESCPGTRVVGVSTLPDHPGVAGLHRLRALLPGSTPAAGLASPDGAAGAAAVVGPPGCGKSSLVDALSGGAPRAGAGSALVPLPGGGALVDTPSCSADEPDWLAERYLSRLRATQRERWRAGPHPRSQTRRRLRPLAGGA